ncbi:MAG TPA: AlpA family transcriptional regulator [Acidobacteriaceae bacterium]|nr:AlpA family transcriptional regulator [Acidobacteriaceae bacterium]
MTEILLRLPEVKRRVGYSKSRLYQLVKDGIFPAPISLGARAVAWPESEISAWIADRIRASRNTENSAAAQVVAR